MNKIKMVALSLAFLAMVACGGESEAISMVKKGRLQLCQDCTVEEMINASVEKPKWKHTVGKNGVDYVSISGLFVVGRPIDGVWQFWVKNGTFGTQALELDKQPQNDFGVIELIKAMCKSTRVVRQQAKAAGAKRGSFTDARDGKTYKTAILDNQTWMAENLNYDSKDSKCYENKPDNCTKYGRLYSWENAKKACPNGWHLPSKIEWEILDTDGGGWGKAGKRLKARSGWKYNGNGTDDYGFSALPGGYDVSRSTNDTFIGVGIQGAWWSATSEYSDDRAYGLNMYESGDVAAWEHKYKSDLLSVRCIQN